MSTLLFTLSGPMQSWGVDSRFDDRATCLEPSKSGTIGLLCAALGRDRSEPINDLATLKFGVRVNKEGHMMEDYQITRDGNKKGSSVVSRRQFLSDASFLVGFEGDQKILESLKDAILKPKWHLCLGRKSYFPDDFNPKIVDSDLRTALINEKFEGTSMKLMIDATDHDGALCHTRPDVPISFRERKFTTRLIKEEIINVSKQTDDQIVA